ncbi:hypothetical protein [Bradyrhizobium sp. USDA 329]|uniref:hypothetical protein n=1 Tax=unclassified Bradyrhizobium TaxID=2631580 RepID=UPI0035124EB6
MFAVFVITVLLAVLWTPSWIVLHRNRVVFGEGWRAVWRIWIAQVFIATALIFLTDSAGLLNPAGYTLGICFLVGLVGAFVLHRSKTNWPRQHRANLGNRSA